MRTLPLAEEAIFPCGSTIKDFCVYLGIFELEQAIIRRNSSNFIDGFLNHQFSYEKLIIHDITCEQSKFTASQSFS